MTPLLCRLGFHAPAWPPRWHDGLYVARCARCGRGIVRTGREGWRAPEGIEVRLTPRERGEEAPPAGNEGAPESEAPSVPQPERGGDPADIRGGEARLMWLGAGLAGAGVVAGGGAALLVLSSFAAKTPPPPPPLPAHESAPTPAATPPAAMPPPAATLAQDPCPSPGTGAAQDGNGRIVLWARDGSRFTVSRPGTPCWSVSFRAGRRR